MSDNPKNTNHIYGSGDKSVIDNRHGDRKGRLGDPLKANPNYKTNKDNPSTDKYYRNQEEGGALVQPNSQTTVQSFMHPESTAPITLTNEADMGGVYDLIMGRLRAGQAQVLVQVTDANLERRLDARLDMAQARQQIEQRQRAAVKIGRPASLLQATVAAPTTEQEADDDLASDIDPRAYVDGDLPEDAIETTGVAVLDEEENLDEAPEADAGEPEDPGDDDDDDDDDGDDDDEEEDGDEEAEADSTEEVAGDDEAAEAGPEPEGSDGEEPRPSDDDDDAEAVTEGSDDSVPAAAGKASADKEAEDGDDAIEDDEDEFGDVLDEEPDDTDG
jgi:hypothetical protein